jgi:hypothetical protein
MGIGLSGSAAFSTSASNTLVTLKSTMAGANEVPGPGDPNASGSTIVILNSVSGQVCYRITVRGISSPLTAGHIHVGAAGVAGPVVIPFPAVVGNGPNFAGCTFADPALVANIIANPAGYYTNVHNASFPSGVERGQLQPLIP